MSKKRKEDNELSIDLNNEYRIINHNDIETNSDVKKYIMDHSEIKNNDIIYDSNIINILTNIVCDNIINEFCIIDLEGIVSNDIINTDNIL